MLGHGFLDLSDGRTWIVTLAATDGSGLTTPPRGLLSVDDWYGRVTMSVLFDANGPGGHLIQCHDSDGTVVGSLGLPAGPAPDSLGLQMWLTQRPDHRWEIVPQYRLLDGAWTPLPGAPWTTAAAFDMPHAWVSVGIDSGENSEFCYESPTAEPASVVATGALPWGRMKLLYR